MKVFPAKVVTEEQCRNGESVDEGKILIACKHQSSLSLSAKEKEKKKRKEKRESILLALAHSCVCVYKLY